MLLDLTKTTTPVTGKHPKFRDTPFEGKDFTVEVCLIGRDEFIKAQARRTIRNAATGVEHTDNAEVQRDLFMQAVQDWSGMMTPNPQGSDLPPLPLPCNTETKALICSKFMVFVNAVVGAATDEGARLAAAEGDALKN